MSDILLLSLEGIEKGSVLYDRNLYEFQSRNRLWNTPHLGLLTIGGILKAKYQVEYLDLNYDCIKHYGYEYVFMSPSTSQAPQAYKLAEKFRGQGVKVAFGGPHVTMVPEEALDYGDIVFAGESEDTLQAFMEGHARRFYQVKSRPQLENIPIPLYESLSQYPYSSIPVQLSRGCPHQCEFCLSSFIYGKRIRRKTPAQARRELSYLKERYQNPFIFFTDDNFLINPEYSLQILAILEELGLKWYAFTDISVYKSRKLLKRLYRSGCRKLLIGFESLNEENLKSINPSGFKSSRVKEYKEAIQTIQTEKIGVVGSFVLGLPGDREASFDELYEFILDTGIYGTNITIATPFPGSRFYNRINQEQRMDRDWSQYDGFTLLYDIPEIRKKQFMEKYRELLERINSPERLQRIVGFYKEQIRK